MNQLHVDVQLHRDAQTFRMLQECQTFPLVLLGPSGSGKTTLLECIAGLLQPDQGRLRWNETIWFDTSHAIAVAAAQRKIGYVMQDGALFPHLSIRDNALYPIRVAHLSRPQRQQRIQRADRLLHQLGLTAIANHRPQDASGGEQVRCALARALCIEPKLLLLDEPFRGLDPQTSRTVQQALLGILRQQQIPTILVTHDRNDALLFAECIWIIMQGQIVQTGTPQQVFPRPATVAIAEYLGVENLLPGQVTASSSGLNRVRCGAIDLHCEGNAAVGTEVYVGVRPEDIVVLTQDASPISLRNQLEVRVQELQVQGTFCWITCVVTDRCETPLSFRALLTHAAVEELHIRQDAACRVGFKASAAHLLPRVVPRATA